MLIRIFLPLLYVFSFFMGSAQDGTIKGLVFDEKTKEPLAGAYVHLNNKNASAVTDAFGQYTISHISPGNYTLTVEYIGYEVNSKEIAVTANGVLRFNVSLAEKKKSLENVNVYGKASAESETSSRHAEKNAGNITNILSAQAMQRSPDVNAANALQRVSAVTLQRNSGSDEAFAIIRGLEPRYNNTLINGVKVTSPDPVSRFISLSVVPSDLLEKIEVSKTLTPEMEGDAIGGTVNLVFKDAPAAEILKLNGSLGYSSIFFRRRYDGFDHGAVQSKSIHDQFGAAYTAHPGNFSRANLDFIQRNSPLTSLLGFTYGRRFLKNKLGFILSDSYQNQYYGTNSQFNIAQPDTRAGKDYQPVIADVANRTYSTQQLNNGLSGHLDYQFNEKNKLSIDNVFLYTFIAQSRLSVDTSILGGNGGRVGPGTGSVFSDNRSGIQRQFVENLKFSGRHVLVKHFLFDWAGVYSSALQKAPDRAQLTTNRLVNPDFTVTPDYLYNVSRIWQTSRNKDLSVAGNLAYKAGFGKNNSLELKAGGLYRHSKRYNNQDFYTLKPAPTSGNGGKDPFTDIYGVNWLVYNVTGSSTSDKANYTAYENISAAYGEINLSFIHFDISGGVRIEKTEQGYDTHPVVLDIKSNAKKTYTDALPSVQLKYKLTDKSNLRASYFKSISRPALYELVPTPTFGESTDITGNPYVKHTTADNFDMRYELYPRNEEQFFVGGFYKNISNPIEFSLDNLSGGQANTSPQNFGTAKAAGR